MSDIYRRKRDFTVCNAVGICATTKEEFVREVFSMPTEPVSGSVCLIGIPAVIYARENPDIAKIYNNCTLAAIDGMPIVKIGKKKGIKCERCSAPDIMGIIFQESILKNKTHFFYGGKNNDVLQKLKSNLERDYPGIQIAGMFSPPFRPLTEKEDEDICREINELRPDFVWVGIGAPKQEIWISEHVNKIHGTVMLGVGAGFDFIAGTLDKAPAWMERIGIEWLFRLLKEPKRLWKRYIIGGLKYIYYNVIDLIHK